MIKRRIQELLFEKGITQQDLAKEINLTPATLSRNLNGLNPPKAEVIVAIANYFKVSTDYLLGLSNEKNYKTLNTNDDIYVKIYDELKDLEPESQQDILNMVSKIKEMLIKKGGNV